MTIAKQNEIVYMHFTVFSSDGTTPLTGQAGSCTSNLRRNGATTAEVVTLGEIGTSGYYYASYTPLSLGIYDLEVLCTDDRVIGEQWEVHVNDIDDVDAVVDAIYVDTQAIDGRLPSDPADESLQQAAHTQTQSDIAGLNDVSTAQVNTEVTNALATYDPPTKAELDTAETNIIAEVDANETKIDTIISNQSTASGILGELLDLLENKLTIDESGSTLNLWNDAGSAIIKTWPITDKDAAGIALTGTGPANRGVRTL